MIAQIYEIQTPQEAEKCIELGVDHMGSVLLSRDEWRNESLKVLFRMCRGEPIKNNLIPLFSDLNTLFMAMDYYRPDYVHFCETLTDSHGNEIELDRFMEYQAEVKARFPEVGIMRSIPIPEPTAHPGFSTLKIARTLEPVTDIFLTDTWVAKAPVTGYIGITGKTLDWKAAKELVLQSRIPVVLAGGLSPENVYTAVMDVLPAGADSCTGTNMLDKDGRPVRFQKDFKKVEAFVQEVHRAGNEIYRMKTELRQEIDALREELKERNAALPAHSVRPSQIMAIEALEDEIEAKEKELEQIKES
jgi:phosphoribosylanthranilate isomerase